MSMIHPLFPILGILAFLAFAVGGLVCLHGLKPWQVTHSRSDDRKVLYGFITLTVGIALSFILTAYVVVTFLVTTFGG